MLCTQWFQLGNATCREYVIETRHGKTNIVLSLAIDKTAYADLDPYWSLSNSNLQADVGNAFKTLHIVSVNLSLFLLLFSAAGYARSRRHHFPVVRLTGLSTD